MKQKRVCIIGAGPSGITALKNVLNEQILRQLPKDYIRKQPSAQRTTTKSVY